MKPIRLVSRKGRRFQACDQDLIPELERLAIWRRPLIAQVSVESSVRLAGLGMTEREKFIYLNREDQEQLIQKPEEETF